MARAGPAVGGVDQGEASGDFSSAGSRSPAAGRVIACAAMSTPVVDVSARTVAHEGTTFFMRPLAEDTFTILVDGVPVGRAVFTFGAANGVSESASYSEDLLTAVAEAWFAAHDAS